MNSRTGLVITSIAAPNRTLQIYAKECAKRGVKFIIVGDTKSPPDFALDDCDFWSIDRQKQSDFELAKNLPENHYARKNIGYLVAMKNEAEIIIETDDDNIPMNGFWNKRQFQNHVPLIGGKRWVNVYKCFSRENIWPRGFALDHLQGTAPSLADAQIEDCLNPIQQGLSDQNPDVDAIYRLVLPLPIHFDASTCVALGENCWCPFNSQDTTWFRAAFPLLYLPSYTSFRVTDIWRSFIAQRVAWTCDWKILFHHPTVCQERNEHDLLSDFEQELAGYLNNGRICDDLMKLPLENGTENILTNLFRCYELLVEKGYLDRRELELVESWIRDWTLLKEFG